MYNIYFGLTTPSLSLLYNSVNAQHHFSVDSLSIDDQLDNTHFAQLTSLC